MSADYNICLGEVFLTDDAGESWTKVPREFGEIRTAAWLPGPA